MGRDAQAWLPGLSCLAACHTTFMSDMYLCFVVRYEDRH